MATPKQISIRSIVNDLNKGAFVPDIQRSYVWLQNPKQRKIEQLFDSLMRGYPIGAFLFWKLNKEDIASGRINFQLYKFIEDYDVCRPHNQKMDVLNVQRNDLTVVLDGQQRLTSLFIGLNGSRRLRRLYARGDGPDAYETKYLHLNLRYTPKEDDPDDCYQFEFKTTEEAKAKTESENWFRLSEAMNFTDRKIIREYSAKHGYSRDEQDVLEDFCYILSSEISYFEESDSSLDKVLKIFIRVNSGGTPLSYSDLLMSILTATFKSDIREKMEQEVDYMRESGFGCVGRDQVLKTCLFLTDSPHIFKLENFNKDNIQKIEEKWDRIIDYLHRAISLVASFGYRSILSSGYIVTTIAHYLYNHQITSPSQEDKDAMQRFVRITQISGYFSSSLDTKLYQIRTLLRKNQNFTTFVQEGTATIEDWQMSEDRLKWLVENVRYGDFAALPLLQVLYPHLDYDNSTFHIDHIYPKSKFCEKTPDFPAEYATRANGFFNLQLLEGSMNESKKAKDPERWLGEQYMADADRQAYLQRNYIPEGFRLDWKSLPEFEERRKEAMLEALQAAFREYNNHQEPPEHVDGALAAD